MLVTRGYRVQWSGKGTDAGRDLTCVESRNSFFMPDEKRWLIQCKHNAKSNKAVGVGDLGDIVDTCAQHSCAGFLLVCSTYPSSAVLQRLESISRNASVAVETTYWDMVRLEQILSTPKNWPLAQRFLPTSANAQDWRIYATESPNNWVIIYKGYIPTGPVIGGRSCPAPASRRSRSSNSDTTTSSRTARRNTSVGSASGISAR